ncbi:MAG: hypothetical protein IJ849_12210 [Selenomonadaceae bacterium]|nr:hypothetical protein [Selenomonadaceae bacterium]
MRNEGGANCKMTYAEVAKEDSGLLAHLPYFQPWAWKVIAIAGTVSFIAGFILAEWAKHTLMK